MFTNVNNLKAIIKRIDFFQKFGLLNKNIINQWVAQIFWQDLSCVVCGSFIIDIFICSLEFFIFFNFLLFIISAFPTLRTCDKFIIKCIVK
jgi:hypothetical protein